MANEIYYSNLGDLRLAEILSQELLLLHADRSSIVDAPGIRYMGNYAGSGSTVLKIPLAGLGGYDRMAAVAENASTSNTALTDASVTLTVARQAIQRQMSDLAGMTDSLGLNVTRLAQSMVQEAQLRLTEMIVNVTDDFTTTVGSTGVNMNTDDWFDAKFALINASVGGPFAAVLYPVQFSDLQDSIRAEVGPWQLVPATQEALMMKGPGYKGNLDGVDIYTSALVPTANGGADSAGGMWGDFAVGYADVFNPNAVQGAGGVVYPAGTRIFVEFERDAAGAMTKIVGNYYCAVSKIQDALGVSIITDR